MSDADFDLPDELDVELVRRIDAVCSQFERQWRDKRAPRIEDYLEQIPIAGRGRGLRELIALEFDLRRESGEAVELESYLARFPDLQQFVRQAFALTELTCLVPADMNDADGVPHPPAQSADDKLPERLGR